MMGLGRRQREATARGISLTLIFTILLELIAPAAWALPEPPQSSRQSTRSVRQGSPQPVDPQLAKVLKKIGHPVPELPGNSEALDGWFPDPTMVAHADPSPSPAEEPDTDDETPATQPTASPTPRRYPVTPENLKAREEKKKAEEAQEEGQEQEDAGSPETAPAGHSPSKEDDAAENVQHKDPDPDHDGIHVSQGPQARLAYLEADPQAPTPSAEWSRQTHRSGRYYPLVGGNTAYGQDELVHLVRDYKDLASSEEFQWDWRSPVAEENSTSLGTAASVKWRLRSYGTGASSLDSSYCLEARTYDRRSPGGRVSFTRREPMKLCEIRLHAALAARNIGDWQLTTTRNGQTLTQDTLHVVNAPAPEEPWSRYRVGSYKAASDLIFYVNDEFATKKKSYDIPAADAQGQQAFQVTWDWLAPSTAHLNRSKRHTYATLETRYLSDGATYSVETKLFDPSYPAGKQISKQTGTGRLPKLDVVYGKGLPTYGSWQLRESIREGATTTENLSVRQIKTSVTTDTPTLPIGGEEHHDQGAVTGVHEVIQIPFHLKVETFPSSWTPEKLNWKLNIKGSNGQTRLYEGSIEESDQSSHSLVQLWNGIDGAGEKFALGVDVDPVLVVSIPEEQTQAPLQAAALRAAALTIDPESCDFLPPYVRVSFCTIDSSISSQIIYNGDTVTYSIQSVKYTFPSIPRVSSLCFPGRFQCPGSISCTVNGFAATPYGDGSWVTPTEVTADYHDVANVNVNTYDFTVVFKMGEDLPMRCFQADQSQTGIFVGAIGGGWWDFYPANLAGDEIIIIIIIVDVEAGGDDPEQAGRNVKKTEQTCSCSCPVTQSSPLQLNLSPGTGLYSRGAIDLAVPTRGYPLAIGRANHSRQSFEEQPNGWSWGFRDSLVVDTAGKVVYHRAPDGKSDAFFLDGAQITPSRKDLTDRLTQLDDRHFQRETKGHDRFLYEIPSGISLQGTDPVPAVLTKMTDQNGNANTLTWDSLGQKLYKMEGPVPGQSICLNWTRGHNAPLLKSAVDHTGRKVQYDYCAYPNPLSPSGFDDLLTEVVQPGCKRYSYSYHPVLGKRHYTLLTSRINGVLQEKAVECDSNPGVLLESTHRLGSTMKFDRTRNPDGSVVSHVTHTAPQGMPQNQDQVTTYHINSDDMVTRIVDAVGNSSTYEYNDDHQIIREVDARGHQVLSNFDDRQNLISSTDHLNRTTLLTYDSRDNVKTVQDARNGVTKMDWDANNNLIAVTDPAQHTSTLTRNSFGQVTSVRDARNIITASITYDALGFPRTVQSAPATPGATPAVTTFTRDTLGRPTQVRDPLGRIVKVRFDERNHPVETTLPAISANGAQESLPPAKARQVFDVNDLLRESIAVDGARTVYTYDSAHRLRSVQTPGNPVPTLLDYDAMENMVKMTNSNSQATTYAFDRLNRNTAMTYPGGDGETFQFDANSNLVAWNRGSYTVTYTFDELDRLKTLDSPTTQDHIALTFDELDRVETMTDNSGTTTYGYTNNYLLDHVNRQSGNIVYGYDDADRLTTLTADGDATQYSYDDRDRLVQATLDGQSVNYSFDQADRPTLMSFSNGVSCQQVFNERDGLLSKRYLRGGSPLFSAKYAYNQLGQRKLEEKKTSNWTKSTRYAYNKRRELSNSYRKVNNGCTIETSYAYDLNHNRIKKDETRYSSNANDQLTSVRRPSQTLAYNTAGQAVTAGDSTYTYSYSDQIKTVNTGSRTATYVYDGNGQRVQKTVDGVISKFLWAGSEIVKEYTGSGDVKAQYFLGGGRTAIKHAGKWNFYLTDGLGSTVMLTDHRGRSVATWDYSDDGETTQMSGSASVYNPFLYTGQELDKETGFYHLRARHYAPSLGKFLSRDPIGYGGGSNLYSYCAGDPINFVDPSGLEYGPKDLALDIANIALGVGFALLDGPSPLGDMAGYSYAGASATRVSIQAYEYRKAIGATYVTVTVGIHILLSQAFGPDGSRPLSPEDFGKYGAKFDECKGKVFEKGTVWIDKIVGEGKFKARDFELMIDTLRRNLGFEKINVSGALSNSKLVRTLRILFGKNSPSKYQHSNFGPIHSVQGPVKK